MESKAKLVDVSRDYRNGKPILSFIIEDIDYADIENLRDRELKLRVTRYFERRSLNANAYFHLLNDQIAKALGNSRFYQKNLLLARYGQREIADDVPITLTTKAPPEYMMEQEFIHSFLAEIREKINQATGETSTWYFYKIYRGSHTYNTQEMAQLIDGTVSEAKELGIETLTPRELARMEAEWNQKSA